MTTPALAQLYLTDGTTYINLLSTQNGFVVKDWRPATPEPKGGGVFQNSPLSESRQLVARYYDNTIENFTLAGSGGTVDLLIAESQRIRQMLENAISYWVSGWQATPVYLVARGIRESNLRYALVYDYRAPGDGNPFASPFVGPDVSIFDDWALVIERGHWTGEPPGTETCVEISGLAPTVFTERAVPTGATDDCYVNETATSIHTTPVNLFAGNISSEIYHIGMRFRSVAIPVGATITEAFLILQVNASQVGTFCYTQVYGENSATPAAFSTYANFAARSLTTAYQNWTIDPLIKDTTVQSVDITDIIQEIIDLGGWASGNNLVIFIRDNGSSANAFRSFASFDNTLYAEPMLVVTYDDGSSVGQTATCLHKVYVANKQNKSSLTDIYYFDASGPSFSSNLVAAAVPFTFLPATPAAGDIIYYIVDNTVANSGPFSSLVHDLSQVATDVSGTWEYYNGGWVTLPVYPETNLSFQDLGSYSVCWEQPSDWTAVTINGVTGLAVRFIVDSVGASPAPPIQANTNIYTITWADLVLESAQVGGDLPALAYMKVFNRADDTGGLNPFFLATYRLLIGTRSHARGSDFTAFINLADEQNIDGVTVGVGGSTSFANDVTSATGRIANYSPSGAQSLGTRVNVKLDNTLTPQYIGRFRLFVRCKQVGGSAGDIFLRVRATVYSTSVVFYTSPTVYTPLTSEYVLLDFGQITIPSSNVGSSDNYYAFYFLLDGGSLSATPDLYLSDFILFPVDEFSADLINASYTAALALADPDDNRYLDIDSIKHPKIPLLVRNRFVNNQNIVGDWVPINAGPFVLQTQKKQSIWFLGAGFSDPAWTSWPEMSYSVLLYKQQRYLSMRGSN